MKVFAGSDHAGLALKNSLVERLQSQGHEVVDLGTHSTESTDYPDYAHAVCKAVLAEEGARGLLVCGTGLGMSIAANRHAGIRAALCQQAYDAEMTRQHNDANVLCLGARVIGGGVAEATLDAFVGTDFEGGRHARRVAKIEL